MSEPKNLIVFPDCLVAPGCKTVGTWTLSRLTGQVPLGRFTCTLGASLDWKSKREELKGKRKPLFTRYVKNPNDIRMALELKHIDDQIAECTEHMELKKGKVGIVRL